MGDGAKMEEDERIVLNISGVRHETLNSCLKRVPATRLSKLTKNLANYDQELDEYYFERHPGVFAEVINYYRTGKLHYPLNVCGPLFEEELEFWGIDPNQVQPCCWMTYNTFRTTEEILTVLDNVDNSNGAFPHEDLAEKFGWKEKFLCNQLSCIQRLRLNLWCLFGNQSSDWCSKIVSKISIAFIVISVTALLAETIPAEKRGFCRYCYYIEGVCNVWFILELLIQLTCCPNILDLIKKYNTLLEILATIAFAVDFSSEIIPSIKARFGPEIMRYVELTAFARICRVFKLTSHSGSMRFTILVIKASSDSLILLFLFILLFALIFGAAVYAVEKDYPYAPDEVPEYKIDSIVAGVWWGLITICTTGYGDLYPRTLLGKLLGGVCGIAGVLTISLPVPIIVGNFIHFYMHRRARSKLPKQKRKILKASEVKLQEEVMKQRAENRNVWATAVPTSVPANVRKPSSGFRRIEAALNQYNQLKKQSARSELKVGERERGRNNKNSLRIDKEITTETGDNIPV